MCRVFHAIDSFSWNWQGKIYVKTPILRPLSMSRDSNLQDEDRVNGKSQYGNNYRLIR